MFGKYKIILAVGFFLATFSNVQNVKAQEFNAEVTVLSPAIQTTNKQVFTSLKNSIQEFMNSRRWTNDIYGANEKIQCNIVINITAVSGTSYNGTIQVQSSRPVYGTNYSSPLINIIDKKLNFSYVEFQPLEYQEGVYINELTAVLSYYAYIMLGYDYDSFSELGGTPYFQLAQTIVNSAQSSSVPGWSVTEDDDRNRYHLVYQILDDRNRDFRKVQYTYHRLGMDIMASDLESGLDHVLTTLKTVQTVVRSMQGVFITRLFFDAKNRELADLFAQAGATQKYEAKNLLLQMDVSNQALYNDKLK